MSTNGFDADDLKITLARFTNKQRSIVCDVSKLERKKPEIVAALLPSATQSCGSNIVSGIASVFGGRSVKKSSADSGYGLKDGHQGYGFYFGGNRSDTDK